MKKVLALVMITFLVGCSTDEGKPQEQSSPAEATAVKVGAKPATTPVFTEGVTYMDFTNTSSKTVDTLWFKAESKSNSGTVDIQRCDEEWAANGGCKSGAKTVLPNVDLPGWKLSLASGATALEPNETAHLKFAVTGTTADVTFKVSNSQP